MRVIRQISVALAFVTVAAGCGGAVSSSGTSGSPGPTSRPSASTDTSTAIVYEGGAGSSFVIDRTTAVKSKQRIGHIGGLGARTVAAGAGHVVWIQDIGQTS